MAYFVLNADTPCTQRWCILAKTLTGTIDVPILSSEECQRNVHWLTDIFYAQDIPREFLTLAKAIAVDPLLGILSVVADVDRLFHVSIKTRDSVDLGSIPRGHHNPSF